MTANHLTMKIKLRIPLICRVACRLVVALVKVRLIEIGEGFVWAEFLISRLSYVTIAGTEKRLGDW